MEVKGVGRGQETVVNEKGAKQSDSPYRLDLIPPLAILAESEVLKRAAVKYGEWNWLNIDMKDHINHLLQHIFAYLAGDTSDDHLVNIACRAHFALELQERAKSEPNP